MAEKKAEGSAEVEVDLHRGFVFPNRMREQRRRAGHPKLLRFAQTLPEIPYIRLSKIERGEVFPRADELRRIAVALGIGPSDLLLDVDAPGFDIAEWALPFDDGQQVDLEEERFAVLLGAALRARRTGDAALSIAALDKDYGLPPVNLSRVENAQKPFARWNEAIRTALYRIFGVENEAELRRLVARRHRSGALDAFLPGIANAAHRLERTRAHAALLRAEFEGRAATAKARGALLVAIEGADGAGKNTAARGLHAALIERGVNAVLLSFPRYESTLGGAMLGEVLGGRTPIPATPHAAAVLYGLDRFESRQVILDAARDHEVVVFDRYIASNMAYQAARVPSEDARAMMEWIVRLETEMFALPRPTLSIYLDTPWETARELILRKRKRSYTDADYDAYEADAALQQRVRANYEAMAAEGLLGPWSTIATCEGETMRSPDRIVSEMIALLPLAS